MHATQHLQRDYEISTVKSGIFHGERQYIVEFILN